MSRKNILLAAATGVYRDKGSKFLAYAWPIHTEADVRPHLEQLKKEHPTARHWCYAWRLGEQGEQHRANDDGEPSGTAGRPILQQIDQQQLTNCLVVVVRYFGGTLLGVRGLIDAYGAAAAEALQPASKGPLPLLRPIRVQCSFELLAELQKLMNEWGLKPADSQYNSEGIDFLFLIDDEQAEPLRQRLTGLYGVNVL